MSSLWTRIVKEGQCSGRKGPGKGRSPAAARAPLSGPEREGRRLLQRLFLLRATAPPGMIRPGILARQPCTGAAAAPSTHPSWTHEDTSVHARGKRPVSRGEAQPAYKQRRWWGSIYVRCASSHAARPGCFSAPPLSHTHSRREPGEGRRLRDGECW